jgi:hypothetical protein
MSTDTTTDTAGQSGTDEEELDTGPDTEEKDEWTPPDKATFDALSEKAKKAADKAAERDKKLREAQAKIKKLESPDSKDTDPDPVSKANARIVRAEAKSVLAANGVDKADLAVVLDVLNLSGVEVDDDGEVDTDALESAVDNLRRIFGGSAPEKKKVPKVVTRDRGGSSNTPADPDSSRYQQFLGRSKV